MDPAPKTLTQAMKTKEPSEKKTTKELDLTKICSTAEIESLKNQDAFMYYSIPGVRNATMLMRDIDISSLGASAAHSRSTPVNKVTRNSRISFECSPDLIIGDILSDNEDE